MYIDSPTHSGHRAPIASAEETELGLRGGRRSLVPRLSTVAMGNTMGGAQGKGNSVGGGHMERVILRANERGGVGGGHREERRGEGGE